MSLMSTIPHHFNIPNALAELPEKKLTAIEIITKLDWSISCRLRKSLKEYTIKSQVTLLHSKQRHFIYKMTVN